MLKNASFTTRNLALLSSSLWISQSLLPYHLTHHTPTPLLNNPDNTITQYRRFRRLLTLMVLSTIIRLSSGLRSCGYFNLTALISCIRCTRTGTTTISPFWSAAGRRLGKVRSGKVRLLCTGGAKPGHKTVRFPHRTEKVQRQISESY